MQPRSKELIWAHFWSCIPSHKPPPAPHFTPDELETCPIWQSSYLPLYSKKNIEPWGHLINGQDNLMGLILCLTLTHDDTILSLGPADWHASRWAPWAGPHMINMQSTCMGTFPYKIYWNYHIKYESNKNVHICSSHCIKILYFHIII